MCGGEIEVGDNDVIFTSPHYPNYYEQGECDWLIKTSPGKQINLRFEDFSVEGCDGTCNCDQVQVSYIRKVSSNFFTVNFSC